MDENAPSAVERLHTEQSDRAAAESRRLSVEAAVAADDVAAVERHVCLVHEGLANSHPADPRFAAKADHARRSADSAEAFAAVVRKVAGAENPADARAMFEPYQQPAPAEDH